MDQYPDQQLDTAYRAYLNNPNAANQTVQATAKGAPTGLQGLAAAAAAHQFQTDQQAQQQQQMMQQQAQGQPPSVVQQLAMQTSQMPGIMGQLGPSMSLAGAPSSPPPQMPQQGMAGGGLVTFAEGGLVIPYDVLEAIQSHFAQGGEIRGFAEGEDIGRAAVVGESNPTADMTAKMSEAAKPKLRGMNPAEAAEEMKRLSPGWTEGAVTNPMDVVSKYAGKVGEAVSPYASKVGKALNAVAPYSIALDPRIQALVGTNVGAAKMASGMPGGAKEVLGGLTSLRENMADEITPASTPAPTPRTSTPEQDQADLSRMLDEYPHSGMAEKSSDFPEPKTYHAATPPGHPQATPKQEVHQEAQNTDPAFSQVKQDMPTTSTAPANSGLGGLMGGNMDLGQVRDLISELRGHQTMDPEIAQQLADLKGDAQTNTIVQSLLGGLGAGLSSPYGGRFALGKAALGALSGYEQGSKGEEDIGKNAFNVLRGYKDAPALEQQKAADILFNQMGDTAKLQSAERTAMAKGAGTSLWDKLALEQYKEENRLAHPEVHGGRADLLGNLTQADYGNYQVKAQEAAAKWAETQRTTPPYKAPTPQEVANKQAELYRSFLASATRQSGGVGGNMGGGSQLWSGPILR